jgi:UDPglucose 6-dehydrogenase
VGKLKILICGAGYVGLSNALLLSSKHQVDLFDISETKRISIWRQDYSFLNEKDLDSLPIIPRNIQVIENITQGRYDFIVVALPTDLDNGGKLSINVILKCLKSFDNSGVVIIKSTLPLGGSKQICDEIGDFVYMPEFLREGSSVHDAFYPSRIVIGGINSVKQAANLYSSCVLNEPEILLTKHKEAECIKLFSNTYLAMRVSFFNEIDSYMMHENIDTEKVIHGMGLDDRIGLYYNNPSFGYGGYCLPKDTEEVSNSLDSILIRSINVSNQTRIKDIAQYLTNNGYKKIGIYKISSKSGVTSARNSATIHLIEELIRSNIELFVYDDSIVNINGCTVVNNVQELFHVSEIVLANRMEPELDKYKDKVFTRDIFSRN